MAVESPSTSPLRVAADITQLVGHTPMLQLGRIVPSRSAGVFAKLEFLNPGGSIKDRAALGMILDAEAKGLLRRGSTIVEATAGNTGVGLALIGVNRGYKVKLFVPEGFAEEKCILMRGFGAEVVRTPEAEGMAGAIREANQVADAIPGAFMAGQFTNQSNPQFHHDTTAAEIWEQMEGRVDGFVAGVGTGGDLLRSRAVSEGEESSGDRGGSRDRRFDSARRRAGEHRVEGIGVHFIPETFHRDVCDRVMMVSDDDAFAMVKRLAAEEGLVGGSSSGAAMFAAAALAKELGAGKRVATIIPDSAERYLSKKIFGVIGINDGVDWLKTCF